MTGVLHVISGLGIGGAEASLVRVATALSAQGFAQHVVSVGERGEHARALADGGVGLDALGVRSAGSALPGLLQLVRLVNERQPDVIQGWMYHGDLFAALAHRLAPGRKRRTLLWNLRASNTAEGGYSTITRLGALLSRWPDCIVANSEAGAAYHKSIGYRPRRMEIVPNGIDTDLFRPDPAARQSVRRELGFSDEDVVVVHAARVDPMKDHALFLDAMSALPGLRGIAAGKDTEALDAPANVRCLGVRADMPAVYSASDIVVSSSAYAEGFSNVIAEGMSAGLVPVATDIGDARAIVGAHGSVVPPRDLGALTQTLRLEAERPASERKARGLAAREHIANRFSLARSLERYVALYEGRAAA